MGKARHINRSVWLLSFLGLALAASAFASNSLKDPIDSTESSHAQATTETTGLSILSDSGDTSTEGTLAINTYSQVVSGVMTAQTARHAISASVRVAPWPDSGPDFEGAQIVNTDDSGTAEIRLPPGKYWIGPTEEAQSRMRRDAAPVQLQSMQIVVEVNSIASVDLIQRSFAP